MTELSESVLKEIGFKAAQEIVGDGRAEAIEVTPGVDHTGKPAYYFAFLIEQDRDPSLAALKRTRLAQNIRDQLVQSGDEGYPFVRVLGHRDWGKRLSA